MNNQVLSILGLARRANRISMGFDAVDNAVENGNARLALYASDASEKTVKRVRFKCELAGVPLYPIEVTMDELGMAIGKRIGVLTVDDRGFAKKIESLLNIKA